MADSLMIDSFVLWAPLLLLAVVALLGFVGCDSLLGLNPTVPVSSFTFKQANDTDETVAGAQQVAATLLDPDPTVIVKAGDYVFVWIWYNGVDAQGQIIQPPPFVKAVSDSAGNEYQPGAGPTDGTGGLAGFRQELWYFANLPNGAPHLQVTATFSAAFDGEKVIVPHAYSNTVPAEPSLLQKGQLAGKSTTASAGQTGSGSSAGELFVFAAVIFKTAGKADALFTQRFVLGGNVTEDGQFPLGQTVDVTFTGELLPDNTPPDWIAQMLVFGR
jgi:hypothetical protein